MSLRDSLWGRFDIHSWLRWRVKGLVIKMILRSLSRFNKRQGLKLMHLCLNLRSLKDFSLFSGLLPILLKTDCSWLLCLLFLMFPNNLIHKHTTDRLHFIHQIAPLLRRLCLTLTLLSLSLLLNCVPSLLSNFKNLTIIQNPLI